MLIICKEFSGFDRTNERLDLLAVDPTGKLVIIELKRDDSGADAYWQAIKYASYFQKTSAVKVVKHSCESMMVRLVKKQCTNCGGTLTKTI